MGCWCRWMNVSYKRIEGVINEVWMASGAHTADWSDEALASHLHTLSIAFKTTFRWITLCDVGNIHSSWTCKMLDLWIAEDKYAPALEKYTSACCSPSSSSRYDFEPQEAYSLDSCFIVLFVGSQRLLDLGNGSLLDSPWMLWANNSFWTQMK